MIRRLNARPASAAPSQALNAFELVEDPESPSDAGRGLALAVKLSLVVWLATALVIVALLAA